MSTSESERTYCKQFPFAHHHSPTKLLNDIESMDTYIASNSLDLSQLLARVKIDDGERAKIATPISSPRLAYDTNRQNYRTPPSNSSSRSRPRQTSPALSSDYGDSSFERHIANLTFEEVATLSGQEIIEIPTDDDSGEPHHMLYWTGILSTHNLSEDDGPTSRCTSPTVLMMEFSRDPVTRAKKGVLVESYGHITKTRKHRSDARCLLCLNLLPCRNILRIAPARAR